MTKEEYISKLRGVVEDLSTKNTPLAVATSTIASQMHDRIFVQGLDSSGSKIGDYNTTKPLYVSDDALPKSGNHTGKRGKKIKTSYYESYKALREEMGRPSGTVDLNMKGVLSLDFRTGLKQESVNKWVNELKSDHNTKKFRGNEDHFNKDIGNMTPEEKKRHKEIQELELIRMLSV